MKIVRNLYKISLLCMGIQSITVYASREQPRGTVEVLGKQFKKLQDNKNELAAYLSDGGNPNVTYNGKSLLGELASSVGKEDMVRFLVHTGVDVHQKDPKGSVLHSIVYNGWSLENFQTLLDHGADLTIKNEDGQTPVQYLAHQLLYWKKIGLEDNPAQLDMKDYFIDLDPHNERIMADYTMQLEEQGNFMRNSGTQRQATASRLLVANPIDNDSARAYPSAQAVRSYYEEVPFAQAYL